MPLLHALEEARLGLGRGAVDLVDQHDVREHGPGMELESRLALVEDVGADHVRGQQVDRALDARIFGGQGAGQRPRERRLADPGIVLDQHVALGQQRDQDVPYDLVAHLDRPLDVGPELGAALRHRHGIEFRQRGHRPMVRAVRSPGFKAQLVSMPVAVERHLVTRGNDLGGELRVALHLLSDEEEGRRRTLTRQSRERRRGAVRMRPVVEGQSHARAGGEAHGNPERPSEPGDDGSGRRQSVPREAGGEQEAVTHRPIMAATHVRPRDRRRVRLRRVHPLRPRGRAAGDGGSRRLPRPLPAAVAPGAAGGPAAMALRDRSSRSRGGPSTSSRCCWRR